jgi:hypothetical protein
MLLSQIAGRHWAANRDQGCACTDTPEAWDGTPSVPKQAPAAKATIKGSQVVPHAVVPVFHIHHNHLQVEQSAYDLCTQLLYIKTCNNVAGLAVHEALLISCSVRIGRHAANAHKSLVHLWYWHGLQQNASMAYAWRLCHA